MGAVAGTEQQELAVGLLEGRVSWQQPPFRLLRVRGQRQPGLPPLVFHFSRGVRGDNSRRMWSASSAWVRAVVWG